MGDMTNIQSVFTLTARQLWAAQAKAAAAVLLWVILAAIINASNIIGQGDAEERKALRTCGVPGVERAMTVYVRMNGKIECWNWR